MASGDFLGGSEFPLDAADMITLDWAAVAYASHASARERISEVAHAVEDGIVVDTAPTQVCVTRDDGDVLSVEATTPVLPIPFGVELMGQAQMFYLDHIGALVCSHLFSLDKTATATSASLSLITPRIDSDDIAGQLHKIRSESFAPDGTVDQAIFKLPGPALWVSIVGEANQYNFAVRSSHAILDFRQIRLEEV